MSFFGKKFLLSLKRLFICEHHLKFLWLLIKLAGIPANLFINIIMSSCLVGTLRCSSYFPIGS